MGRAVEAFFHKMMIGVPVLKKLCLFCLFLLVVSLCVTACGKKEDSTLLGAWCYTDTEEKSDMVWCFGEQGHLLTLTRKDGQIVSVMTAHYIHQDEYVSILGSSTAVGTLHVEFQKGSKLLLSFTDEDGNPVIDSNTGKAQGLTFVREKTTATPLVGNWVMRYDEGNDAYVRQYAFEDGGIVAIALLDESGAMIEYQQSKYTYADDGALRIYDETDEGIVVNERFCVIAFPYEGYMTLEEVTNESTKGDVLILVHVDQSAAES